MAESTKNPRTVMVAIDGSKHSVYAFEWFMRHIYKADDLVVMAYCTEVASFVGSLLKDIGKPGAAHSIMQKNEIAANQVNRIVEELVRRYKIKHKLLHLPPPAGESLVKSAKDNQAVLIIAGSRGNNTARRTIMGGTARFLVTHAGVPVFVCKHRDEQKRLK